MEPITLSSPVTIQAAADGDIKGPRKFEMTAYTGGAMNLRGWANPVVVDMAGIQGMDRQRPVLHNHNSTERVGHTTSITARGGKLLAMGIISGASDLAKQICAEADSGFPWQASIGAKVIANQFVPEDMTAEANGQTFEGPINIARKTLLGEISFVSLGADDNTSARIAAHKAENGTTMNFEQWLEAKGFASETLNDAQRAGLEASYKLEHPADPKAKKKPEKKVEATSESEGDDFEAIAAAAVRSRRKQEAEESKRISKIRSIYAKASNPKMTIEGETDEVSIEAYAIEQGWNEEKTELNVLRAKRPNASPNGAFSINTGAGSQPTPDILAASACISAGMKPDHAMSGLDDKAKNIVASKQFRGIGLHAIMGIVGASMGIHVMPGRIDSDVIGKILRAERDMDIRADATGGYSTMSLSGITENILNKAMLEAYGAQNSVVPDVCFETDTNDFKQYKRYRMTASGTMQPVGATGELKALSLQDESYANQVKTDGCIITITRQILINDDMGALSQMPTVVGRQAALDREKAVFTTLLGNAGSFFASGNSNYLSGAGSALSITALTSAEQKFLEQKDANGDPISLNPTFVLVPPALKVTAENLYSSATIIATALGSTSAKTVEPSNNPHKSKYRVVWSPFLGAQGGLTGKSDTGWYLLTAPAGGFAVVQVGYLRGQRTPIIERAEAPFNTLGMSMRCYYDFGVALHDSRCGVLSAGA